MNEGTVPVPLTTPARKGAMMMYYLGGIAFLGKYGGREERPLSVHIFLEFPLKIVVFRYDRELSLSQ